MQSVRRIADDDRGYVTAVWREADGVRECRHIGLESAPQISSLAADVESAEGLYFVSAFGGLLAPHWRDDARGTLVGLTLAHDRRHVSRAVLEGIAFQCKEVVDAMVADTAADGAAGVDLAGLRVDGGVSRDRSSPCSAGVGVPVASPAAAPRQTRPEAPREHFD